MRFRHEIKFVVDLGEAERFFEDLSPYCNFDKHADQTHSYEICSTYYDTKDLRFYLDREESIGHRRKIRLRAYNTDSKSTALFIEIKEKHKNHVAKKRINMKTMDILDSGIPHNELPLSMVIEGLEDTEYAREMDYLHRRLKLYPAVVVRYIRKALIPIHEDDMRITLDTKITAGGTSLSKYNPDEEKFICDPKHGVLEIKTNQSIPLWLQSITKRYSFKHTNFSKYCLGIDAIYGERRPWMEFSDLVDERELSETNIAQKAK